MTPKHVGREDAIRRNKIRRVALGVFSALASMAALTVAMLPLRDHLSIATTALVLVVPVVIGAIVGGFLSGVISVGAGFLVYVVFFIQPYLTLYVGKPENWAPLGVYVVVMVPVARVVSNMNQARKREGRKSEEIRGLFELSDLLVADKPLDELLSVIVTSLATVFGSRKVALLLPGAKGLDIVASTGEPFTDEEIQGLVPAEDALSSIETQSFEQGEFLAISLSAAARPVGLLVVSGEAAVQYDRETLMIFANQIALAVERAQLREDALRASVTEEMARLARILVAAVSHDLRAPLASIKASSSTLSDSEIEISDEARHGLAKLIDVQADRLADIVRSLLDMSRIQAGVLEPRSTITAFSDLANSVVRDLADALRGHTTVVDVPDDLPPVDVDVMLISRVLTNLLTNAVRQSPKDASITIRAEKTGEDTITVSVTDHGPGVPQERHGELFAFIGRRDNDTGAGLGLSIAKTFVEAHHQRIWVEDAPGGGAKFCFTLPLAGSIPEETRFAEDSHY
jgi:two-component system sensor histidine kinase KdpD